MRIFPRRALSAAVATVSVLALATLGPPQASAASFYDPPSPLPAGRDGDVIRHEASTFCVDPSQPIKADADVQRIMYLIRDTHDSPIAATGTVLTPHSAWHGAGPRPIVSYAVGTQGEGDDCAPSKALATGFEYEGPFIAGLLTRGRLSIDPGLEFRGLSRFAGPGLALPRWRPRWAERTPTSQRPSPTSTLGRTWGSPWRWCRRTYWRGGPGSAGSRSGR